MMVQLLKIALEVKDLFNIVTSEYFLEKPPFGDVSI